MKNLFFLFSILLLTTASACSKDDDNSGPRDIDFGVTVTDAAGTIFKIVLADRNVGATKVGDVGTLFASKESLTACPEGYHLLTYFELNALIADSRYNTPQKFCAAFQIPWTEGEEISTGGTSPEHCSYWIFGPYDDGSGDCLYMSTSPVMLNWIGTNPNNRYPVRCVKGAKPAFPEVG